MSQPAKPTSAVRNNLKIPTFAPRDPRDFPRAKPEGNPLVEIPLIDFTVII